MKTNVYKKLDGSKFKFGVIVSRFNQEITQGLLRGCLKSLKEAKVKKENVKVFEVPGSFEIPLVCKKLAKTKKFDGLISLGAVIKGETAHFDYIAKEVSDGIMRVMLDYNIPITFGVITTYNFDQAKVRSMDDEHNKGREAALAALELANLLKAIK